MERQLAIDTLQDMRERKTKQNIVRKPTIFPAVKVKENEKPKKEIRQLHLMIRWWLKENRWEEGRSLKD
jgi:hypothetical protein